MSNNNANCDGEHCVDAGEVRVYPLGGGANLILCMRCFAHENRYRFERVQTYVRGGGTRERALVEWPQVDWATAERYPKEGA